MRPGRRQRLLRHLPEFLRPPDGEKGGNGAERLDLAGKRLPELRRGQPRLRPLDPGRGPAEVVEDLLRGDPRMVDGPVRDLRLPPLQEDGGGLGERREIPGGVDPGKASGSRLRPPLQGDPEILPGQAHLPRAGEGDPHRLDHRDGCRRRLRRLGIRHRLAVERRMREKKGKNQGRRDPHAE